MDNPAATYRVQLFKDFGFQQAADIISYISDLGVSHLYTSPYLQAAAGSTHGYDVVDPTRVNEELGGAEAHARLCQALQSSGLGQISDVVPNHMAIAGRQNPWWWDVLENGPSSRYATYFDVDWESSDDRWPNKVLLPVLGDHYGRILEDGQLRLSHRNGSFTLRYQDHVFPTDPSSLAELLRKAAGSCGSELLAFLAESHSRLPRPTVTARQAVERRHRDKAVLLNLLTRLCHEAPETGKAITAEVACLNHNPDALDVFIDQQNYRLAFWRTASRELGYRRFFDIKDLVGLRIEDAEVFHATHELLITWVQEGWVQGLRIDHPDGLRDPTEYFHRLREACPNAWIVAEKILAQGEKLPSEWPIAGTTGYDFLNLMNGLFIDPAGEKGLTEVYENFTEQEIHFTDLVHESKRLVLTDLLESELNRLTSLFLDICEGHRRHRDYTRHALHWALRETAVHFPVYRSYVSASRKTVTREDEISVIQAIEGATRERPDLDADLFSFLQDLLLLRVGGPLENELAMRFQQLTGPAMAKGVEDTALYRWHRLVALNEVGGDPSGFGVSLDQFHDACTIAQREHPLGMLASTTHDTKRSEDVRARLAVLSEIPERWTHAVHRWADHNERHRRGDLPDRNIEYLFYQTVVGAWPIDVARITAYLEKAVREAKIYTSWTRPDEVYERTVREFAIAVMEDESFRADLEGLVADLILPGRINSLAQTLIKLTSPGVPDIYQGTELWDLSLVDPDNRRPVDFALRRRLLEDAARLSAEAILARMDEGLPKLWVIRQALHLRRGRPEIFGPKGAYRPLYAHGTKAQNVVAFLRGEAAVSVAPRLVIGLQGGWADTVLELPAGHWHNILTHDEWPGGPLLVRDILARFPVGLLVRNDVS
ncbi:MAG: malto-oligosyltrehalose synthase [Deltaproteobacteria bacterium]|nr:malto-oligosyltrehalose synthase [Deltaproteobacteria bacterium]